MVRSERLLRKCKCINDWGGEIITRNCTQYSLTWVFLLFTYCILFVSCVLLLVLSCLVCNCCWLAVCIFVVVFFVLLSSYVYFFTMCALLLFTLDAGLLTSSQHSEGPATDHFDTGFSWFPCA